MADKKKRKKPAPTPEKKKGFPAADRKFTGRRPKPEGEPTAPTDEAQDPDLARERREAEAPEDREAGQGTPSGIKKAEEGEGEVDPHAELNQEIDANFKLAWEAEREWIEEAKEDIEFKAGNQWSDNDKQILAAQKRPCLTFNKIKAIVKLITGHFIQNSARIQVSPEGGEDQKFSDVADRVLDHIDEHAQLEFNLGYLFGGGQTTGKAYIELYQDFERDPIFGHLRSIYHGRPGTIIMDPRGTSYDLNQDREFGFKIVRRTKAKLKELYPDKEKEIEEISSDTEREFMLIGEEGDANNYGISKTSSTTIGLHKTTMEQDLTENPHLHVKEYWRFKYVDKWFVYFVVGGDMPRFDSEELAKAEIEKRKATYIGAGGLEEQFAVIMKKRKVREMHVAVRCGGVILTDGLSPFEPDYSGFPFFQDIADWTPEAEKQKDAVQGIVRCLKDPQREKNKARSQMLHIINTSANSGWIIDNDSMDDHKKEELKDFGSSPGIVIEKNSGKSVERIEPTPAPVAQAVREKAADDSFKEVSGVNADLLAVDDSANPSGKAIALRIRQAITILEPDFRNFRYTKKLIGTAIVQMIPTLFDVPKLKKILGETFLKANAIDDVFLKTFLMQIEDLRYNVRIAERGDTKTMREETFEDLMQMLEKGIGIPFDVLVEFMTVPNKAEMISKVQAYQAQQQAAAAQAALLKGAPGAGAAPAQAR